MKRLFFLGVALFSIFSAVAQSPRIYRSEFLTYDKREDAAIKDINRAIDRATKDRG